MAKKASTQAFLKDASTRHAIYIQRLASGQLKEARKILSEARRALLRGLKRKGISKLGRKQLNAYLRKLDREQERIYKKFSDGLKKGAEDFAQYESEFSAKMFTNASSATFTVPATAAVNKALKTAPIAMISGKVTIEAALQTFSRRKRAEMVRVIKDGITSGMTSTELTRAVEMTATGIQRNHASALVRTITNHASTVGRQATIDDNSDIIKGVEWVATLDGRTTSTCASLDGQVFEQNKGPRPPLHWGCRSTVIPVVKKEYNITQDVDRTRPSVGPNGAQQVDGRTNYNSWLRKQPANFQDDVLGRTKGKLFREGGLGVDKFVDNNHKPLTLSQLKRKQPQAFDKAGLNNDDE